MPAQVPDFLANPSPDGLQRPHATTSGGTRRVLPSEIPAFLQNQTAHAVPAPDNAQPERVLPSDVASEDVESPARHAPFSFPSAPTIWKRM